MKSSLTDKNVFLLQSCNPLSLLVKVAVVQQLKMEVLMLKQLLKARTLLQSRGSDSFSSILFEDT
jgi:hypothetical protein